MEKNGPPCHVFKRMEKKELIQAQAKGNQSQADALLPLQPPVLDSPAPLQHLLKTLVVFAFNIALFCEVHYIHQYVVIWFLGVHKKMSDLKNHLEISFEKVEFNLKCKN
ncbi:MAG: hypothetical protein KJ630_06585 [Proteobacteria bacterium]|nr:hypothetical protein [Pseudomonadota bacterium]